MGTNLDKKCDYCLARQADSALSFGYAAKQETYLICQSCLENWQENLKYADKLKVLRPNFIDGKKKKHG
jgi:superfamily II helicase